MLKGAQNRLWQRQVPWFSNDWSYEAGGTSRLPHPWWL